MRWTHQILATADPETIVTVEAIKADLDITFDDDNDLVAAHRSAAIRWVENYTNRFLGLTTVHFYSDRIPSPFHLPFSPVQSVTSLSVAGSVIEGPSSTPGEPWALAPPTGQVWPFFVGQPGAVQVEFVAGYPVGEVPAEAVQAVKLVCGIFYDRPDKPEADWESVRNLLSGLRVRTIG